MRRTKSWIVGIACGALCAVCVFMYLQDAGAQVDAARAEALERFGGEQVEVCVAKRDIAAGEVVDASSFEKRMWVTALLPEDPLTQDSDVLGKQVTSTVLKGEVLTSRRFEESPSSIDVPGELTAVSVPARDVQTVGGALRPGMFVDVYATGSAGSAGTTLIAHSVLVLATNASSSSKSGADSVSHTDENRARVASVSEVVSWAIKLLSHDDLRKKRILVIGGRSEEPLDSMRLITNRSSGLMAVTLAQRAFERGADVELWMGGGSVDVPDFIPVKRYETVGDLIGMLGSIDHDLVIVPAALADFTPEKKVEGKIPSGEGFTMSLKPVPKVLPLIRGKCQNVIGYKAESGLSRSDLVKKARGRLEEYDLMACVANDVDSAGKTSASMILVTRDEATDITGSKAAISDMILNFVAQRL